MNHHRQSCKRAVALALLCSLSIFGNVGCRLHSPLQEALAKDIQSRYKLVSPSALEALESLDNDLDRLVEAERADFEVYKETSETELVNATWSQLFSQIDGLNKGYDVGNKTVTLGEKLDDLKHAIDS